MTKWEYYDDLGLSNEELDELGSQGWELVAVNVTPWSYEDPRKGGTESGTTVRYTFKRPLEEIS